MKQIKNVIASASISVLIALFASCSGTVDETYTNAIPIDASIVVRVDVPGLMEKAEYKDYQTVGTMIGSMYGETISDTPQIIDSILVDPKGRGVDLKAPIYYFIASDGISTGLLMRVNDKEEVEKWLHEITTTMGSSSPTYTNLDDNHLLIYDQYRDVQWQMPASPVAQFNQSAAYTKMKEMDGEVRYSCNTRDLCVKFSNRAITSQPAIYTETWLVGACNFDKGSASLTAGLVGKSPEAEAGIAAFKAALHPSEGKFIKYLPESTTVMLSLNGKGADYLDYLTRTPFLESAVGSNLRFWKAMFEVIDGEAAIALTGISDSGFSIVAYAELLPEVTDNQMREILSRWGLDKSNWGIKDNCLYWTTDKALAENAFKEASPSFNSSKYGKHSDGKPVYVLMDMEKLLGNPLLGQAAQQVGQNSQFFSFLASMEYELNGNHELVMKVNLKDDKENVLKQIVNLLAN